MLYLLFKSIISAVVVLGVSALAQIHPKWGGVIAVAPIVSTFAIVFLSRECTILEVRQVVLYSVCFMLPTTCFLVVLYWLLGRYSMPVSLGGAYIVWFILVVLVLKGIKFAQASLSELTFLYLIQSASVELLLFWQHSGSIPTDDLP